VPGGQRRLGHTPLFCKFGSIKQYADNAVNTNKVCSLSYSATPQMKYSGNDAATILKILELTNSPSAPGQLLSADQHEQ
jgi:hypothetical protein